MRSDTHIKVKDQNTGSLIRHLNVTCCVLGFSVMNHKWVGSGLGAGTGSEIRGSGFDVRTQAKVK